MDFDHDNVRLAVEEDRLSSLPDELIHKILSSFDTKFAVQTCLLSPRWKLLWTSIPSLNFSSGQFPTLPKFSKFITNVLSHRNHQIEVSSVNLDFHGAASQVFVKKIANYAFSHNIQQLTVSCWPKKHYQFPPSLFTSHSLKHFTISNGPFNFSPSITPKTPWDFPSLTSLHISHITLCDNHTQNSLDLFSKCVNLTNLTIEHLMVKNVGVFDIITPRLSNLTLYYGKFEPVINLIAPQLKNLTITNCSIDYLNVPPQLSSFYYRDHHPMKLSENRYYSLNKVSICLYYNGSRYEEGDAHEAINMLQKLHSARYLTLNWDIIECISSFSDLFSHHPSPFSNLVHLTIGPSGRKKTYQVKISDETRNFFLENSPNAIMELPEAPPTKAMKQKEARAKKKAQQAAEIEAHMEELKILIDGEYPIVERQLAKEKANTAFKNLLAELPTLSLLKIKTSLEKMKMQVDQEKVVVDQGDSETERLMAELKICVEEVRVLVKEEKEEAMAILVKEALIRSLLENLGKRERTQVEARYSRQLEETKAHSGRLLSEIVASEAIFAFEKLVSDTFLKYEDVSGIEKRVDR
ncbi:hypothetical protein LXL04_025891 [Taraxacum kok-saghyz]